MEKKEIEVISETTLNETDIIENVSNDEISKIYSAMNFGSSTVIL